MPSFMVLHWLIMLLLVFNCVVLVKVYMFTELVYVCVILSVKYHKIIVSV